MNEETMIPNFLLIVVPLLMLISFSLGWGAGYYHQKAKDGREWSNWVVRQPHDVAGPVMIELHRKQCDECRYR